MSKRRRFSGELKAKIALEALRGDRTLQEIASKHQVHPNQVSAWKRQAIAGLGEVFSNGGERRRRDHESEVRELHAKIGELTVERDFFVERVRSMGRAERRALVRRAHPELSVSRQCRLLSVGRSSLYYTTRGESEETLALMRRIDALFLKHPFYGARQMVRHLRREGVRIGRRRAGRLMRLLGLQAIYRAPRLSAPHPAHRVYPYLLKGLTIERANQVWCADITYIPVRCGCLYLVAIMDWASRHVLAWRLSNTLDAGFCVEALDDALARHGPPEIFNTDQGSQFTSGAFTGRLQAAGIQISMDGRGRCMDNIFIERLWRSLKYEAVYLHELADGLKARRVIGEWDRLLHYRAATLGARRANASRGLPRRPACGYDGHVAPRRAVPTSPQAAEHRHGNQGPRNQAA